MSRYTVQYGTLVDNSFAPLIDCLANFPIYDEEHRAELVGKIYNRYRFREIGFETPAMFVHYLNATLTEIMPVYNELYRSAALEYDPLNDVNYVEETVAHSGTSTTGTNGNTSTTTSSGHSQSAHSDTPQGSFNFASVTANDYLSDADATDSSGSSTVTDSGTSSGTATTDGTGAKHVHGKTASKSYQMLIKEFRENIINIDKMILDDIATCFMGVY